MLESALQEFWRLFGLQAIPSSENNHSVELDGGRRILVAKGIDHVTLSGFLSSRSGSPNTIGATVLSLCDYRNSSDGKSFHPIISPEGNWGLLCLLPQSSLSGYIILQAFEKLSIALENIDHPMES